MKLIAAAITLFVVSVHSQNPSTVPGLFSSAALNAPVNVLRVRQPTSGGPPPSRPRPPVSPISSNLLDHDDHHDHHYPSDPYNFGFDVRDDFGNHQYRKEEADGHGTVRGTYGYTDANGLFRYVDYIADANGFQAKIRSNEPGIGNGQAASILLSAEEPPRNILDLPSAPRPTLQRLRNARLPENVAFNPIDIHPISSERSSERLRYSFPLPSENNEAASAPEEIIFSDVQPAASSTNSPLARGYRGERLTNSAASGANSNSNNRK